MTDQTQPEQDTVQLQISDLQAILQVVDILSSRGAVRPDEMQAVGTIRNKLATFLAAVVPQSAEPANAGDASNEDEAQETDVA